MILRDAEDHCQKGRGSIALRAAIIMVVVLSKTSGRRYGDLGVLLTPAQARHHVLCRTSRSPCEGLPPKTSAPSDGQSVWYFTMSQRPRNLKQELEASYRQPLSSVGPRCTEREFHVIPDAPPPRLRSPSGYLSCLATIGC